MSELLSVFRCEQWPLWVAGAHAMSPLVTHASQIRCSLSSDGEVMLPELRIALHASSVLHINHSCVAFIHVADSRSACKLAFR